MVGCSLSVKVPALGAGDKGFDSPHPNQGRAYLEIVCNRAIRVLLQ